MWSNTDNGQLERCDSNTDKDELERCAQLQIKVN